MQTIRTGRAAFTQLDIAQGEQVAATLVKLPRHAGSRSGLLGRLADAFAESDRGLVSAGPAHFLPAPMVLAIMAIHDELTVLSGV